MSPSDKKHHTRTVEQVEVIVPNLSIKDLLSAIPPHCFERSALKSAMYPLWDLFVIGSLWKLTTIADFFAAALPPMTRSIVSFSLWSLYGFFVGLFGMGLWVVAHEAGHGAFSTSRNIDNCVGWILHSSLGVPYHSWRISHAKHHAATGHMTRDQVFVPWTRSQMGLPSLDKDRDDILGSKVSAAVQNEIWEAIGESPIVALLKCIYYLFAGLPVYLLFNIGGQSRYPKGTNHFFPSSIIFSKDQHSQIMLPDLGIFIWLAVIILSCGYYSFATVFRVYLVPYIWVNHWLVLITFLHHSDLLVPIIAPKPSLFLAAPCAQWIVAFSATWDQ